jgi:HD-like signal output (HDOD) protein
MDIIYPDPPEVLIRFKDVQGDLNAVGKLIEEYPELAKEVLSTINAPYFNLVREIKSAEEAARMLGMGRVVNLTTGRLLRTTIFKGERQILKELWGTSLKVAVIGVLVAKETKLAAADEVYTTALMHNAGMGLMAQQVDDYINAIKPSYFSEDKSIEEFEQDLFNLSHPDASAQLAIKWGLPAPIIKAIKHHHSPDAINKMVTSGTDEGEILLVLKVAEHIARLPGYLAQAVNDLEWERIKDAILDELKLTEGMFKRVELTIKKKLAELKG